MENRSATRLILLYTWPQNPLLPKDPYEKATVHFWAKFVEEKLTEGLRNILLAVGEEMEKEVKQFEEAWEILEGEAKGIKKLFGGESIGLLDLVLGWSVIWLELVEDFFCGKKLFSLGKYPCLEKWMEEFKELDLIKENLPSREIMDPYYQNIREMVLAFNANK